MPTQQTEGESPIAWLAKSIGFVDKVCCYSYSEQQIFSESDTDNIYATPDWDVDDNSILELSKEERNDKSKSSQQVFNYKYKHRRDPDTCKTSPARSISTASTVTTSTTTTVVTSTRVSPNAGGSSSSSSQRRQKCLDAASRRFHHDTFHSEGRRTAPDEIFCTSSEHLRNAPKMIRTSSRLHPTVPVTFATEGYQC